MKLRTRPGPGRRSGAEALCESLNPKAGRIDFFFETKLHVFFQTTLPFSPFSPSWRVCCSSKSLLQNGTKFKKTNSESKTIEGSNPSSAISASKHPKTGASNAKCVTGANDHEQSTVKSIIERNSIRCKFIFQPTKTILASIENFLILFSLQSFLPWWKKYLHKRVS